MKLHYSPESQYVRKVMATAIETGLIDRIELIRDKKDLDKQNPVLKRPTLITDDGAVIVDSPIVCEYLDVAAGGAGIVPPPGPARWRARTDEAICDTAMESVTAIRHDRAYHEGAASDDLFQRHIVKVRQSIDHFEAAAAKGELDGRVDIGTLTIGVFCGYLDYRMPELEWRDGHPKLAAWYETFSKRPSMERTRPNPDG